MNYLSLRCCDTFELGFIPIICYPIFLLFILIYMFPGYSCYSCNLCMLVVRIPIYCIPLFILVICYPDIPVTYSRYLLYNFYCCIFPLPVIEIFLLLTHVICIIHVYTHTHCYSTYHLKSTSCIPVTGSCYIRCYRHLLDHVLIYSHCNTNHLEMGRLNNWSGLIGWVFGSIIVSLQRTW